MHHCILWLVLLVLYSAKYLYFRGNPTECAWCEVASYPGLGTRLGARLLQFSTLKFRETGTEVITSNPALPDGSRDFGLVSRVEPHYIGQLLQEHHEESLGEGSLPQPLPSFEQQLQTFPEPDNDIPFDLHCHILNIMVTCLKLCPCLLTRT